jgi:hypothetical protein
MLYFLLRQTEGWLNAHGWYRLFGVLDFVEFRALAAAGLSFLLVLALGPATIAWLRKMKIGAGSTGLLQGYFEAYEMQVKERIDGEMVTTAVPGISFTLTGVQLLSAAARRHVRRATRLL